MNNEKQATIVIPCFNEAKRLNVNEFGAFATANPDIHFIFVNDGSTDETGTILQQMEQKDPQHFTAIDLMTNVGKAAAVRTGMLCAFRQQATYAGYWDADLATPLAEILRMLEVLDTRDDIDLVMGSRVKLLGVQIERHLHRHYLGRVFATAASIVLNLGVYDTQCGAKIFRVTPAIEQIFARKFKSNWIFDVEIIARFVNGAANHKNRILELPLLKWVDVDGSKVKPRDFLLAIIELARIYYYEIRSAERPSCPH